MEKSKTIQGAAPAMGAIAPVHLPPGYRFHPTDEELVNYYLRRKIHGLQLVYAFIPELNLYNYEPWELQDKSLSPSRDDPGAKLEWYLFGLRGPKHANGFQMNRATRAGFWKSTGKDRPVMHHHITIGMKKTLVYHLGRAPNGMQTDWVMHEYRLHHHHHHHIKNTYTMCRVFNKNAMIPSMDIPGGVTANIEGMQPVPDGVGTDKDKSWMEFICNDDYWNQFISDDTLYSSST